MARQAPWKAPGRPSPSPFPVAGGSPWAEWGAVLLGGLWGILQGGMHFFWDLSALSLCASEPVFHMCLMPGPQLPGLTQSCPERLRFRPALTYASPCVPLLLAMTSHTSAQICSLSRAFCGFSSSSCDAQWWNHLQRSRSFWLSQVFSTVLVPTLQPALRPRRNPFPKLDILSINNWSLWIICWVRDQPDELWGLAQAYITFIFLFTNIFMWWTNRYLALVQFGALCYVLANVI